MRSSAFNAPASLVSRSAVRSSEVSMFFGGGTPVSGIQVPPGNAPPRSKAPAAKKAPVRKAAAKKAPAKKAAPVKKKGLFGK